MRHPQRIGILGGTFDPIHNAHIQVAEHVLKSVHLQQVRFIPCGQPSHRSASASAKDRLMMVKLALASHAHFITDGRELKRKTPSYTVDTLHALRREFGQIPLYFILGNDAFASLNTWKDWQHILRLIHLVVVHRPHAPLPQSSWIEKLLKHHAVDDPKNLHTQSAGLIYQLPMRSLAVCASKIRKQLSSGYFNITDVPAPVLKYIREHQLYHSEKKHGY
jgi:nicotinate-nucleotide adenylyltransferase